jgi:putative hydrolase of HD superfamily
MDKYISFFFELGQLKYVPRSGWHLLGIRQPESVAEHSARTAQIAYVLAKLEKYENPAEVAVMALFHDMAEARVNDKHKVAARYIQVDEERAVKEQIEDLLEVKEDILRFWKETEERSTVAGNIAKDADSLEVAITAKEYMEQGYSMAENWIERSGKRLVTESAKKLHEVLKKTNPNDWWNGLKVK